VPSLAGDEGDDAAATKEIGASGGVVPGCNVCLLGGGGGGVLLAPLFSAEAEAEAGAEADAEAGTGEEGEGEAEALDAPP